MENKKLINNTMTEAYQRKCGMCRGTGTIQDQLIGFDKTCPTCKAKVGTG